MAEANNTHGPFDFTIEKQVHIMGNSAYVEKENQNLQEFDPCRVTQDAKLAKCVVKVVVEGIPVSKLTLLEKSLQAFMNDLGATIGI